MPSSTSRPDTLFQIRPEQVDFLEHESFPRQLYRAIVRAWPERTAAMTEESLRTRLETTIESARGHGIEKRENITRYVHLTFLLGREDFDTAPETSWAAVILGWEMDETKKLDKLEKRVEIEQERQMSAARREPAAVVLSGQDDKEPPQHGSSREHDAT